MTNFLCPHVSRPPSSIRFSGEAAQQGVEVLAVPLLRHHDRRDRAEARAGIQPRRRRSVRLTGILFAVVTLAMQAMLARVLERRPAPAPRLTPLAAWPLGILTWMFVTMFCVR